MQGLVPRRSRCRTAEHAAQARLDGDGRRRGLRRRRRHELRAELPPLPAARRPAHGVARRSSAIVGPKKTGLGEGYFITTLQTYRDQDGEVVGEMRFRILKFKPGQRARRTTGRPKHAEADADRAPAAAQDSAFFWEGLEAGELRIQRCGVVRRAAPPAAADVPALPVARARPRRVVGPRRGLQLRRPPPARRSPAASTRSPSCSSSSRRARASSATSSTSTRPTSRSGCRSRSCSSRTHEEGAAAVATALTDRTRFDEVNVGDELPALVLDLTPTLIVSTAIATRDYQDVHHDRDLAAEEGVEGHLHEHPHDQRVRRAVHHRLGRPGGDPARRSRSGSVRRTTPTTR